MWILDWLPYSIIYGMILVSIGGIIASAVLGFIPFIATYKIPLQTLSIVLLVASVWLAGGISEREAWEAKVAKAQLEVSEKKASSAEANVKIIEKIVEKKIIIKEKGDSVIQYVDRETLKIDDSKCVIPPEVVKAMNAAALGVTIEDLPK